MIIWSKKSIADSLRLPGFRGASGYLCDITAGAGQGSRGSGDRGVASRGAAG